MIPDEVIIRAGTNMLAHTDMVPLEYVRQALAEVRELPRTVNRGERMKRYADIVRFVDRCLDDIRRGYTTRNIELRRNARQALIDALARKQESPDTIRALLEERDALRKAAEEFGGYVLDDELREEARAALSKENSND